MKLSEASDFVRKSLTAARYGRGHVAPLFQVKLPHNVKIVVGDELDWPSQ